MSPPRRDLVAEAAAGFGWGLLVSVFVLAVVSGLLSRHYQVFAAFDPATGAGLPTLIAILGGLLGIYYRYSIATDGHGHRGSDA